MTGPPGGWKTTAASPVATSNRLISLAPVKFDRVERFQLGAIMLGFASLPLLIHFVGPVAWSQHTGPIMAVGLVVAGGLAMLVLRRAARREAKSTSGILLAAGFAPLPVSPADVSAWIPPGPEGRPAWIDDFDVPGLPAGTRNVWHRRHPAGTLSVYQITVRNGTGERSLEGYTIASLETPAHIWPTFWLRPKSVLNRLSDLGQQHRLELDLPAPFRDEWLVYGHEAAAVGALLNPAMQDAVGASGDWIVAARRERLFVFIPGAALLTESCTPWVAESVRRLERILRGRDGAA